MTASQSSSDMLNSILSRVMPALLTTMSQPTKTVGGGDEFVGGAALADVTLDRDGLRAGRDDLVEDVRLVQRRGHVVDHDGGTRTGQADRLCPAQARGRTGHHRDPAGQIGQVVLLCTHL